MIVFTADNTKATEELRVEVSGLKNEIGKLITAMDQNGRSAKRSGVVATARDHAPAGLSGAGIMGIAVALFEFLKRS